MKDTTYSFVTDTSCTQNVLYKSSCTKRYVTQHHSEVLHDLYRRTLICGEGDVSNDFVHSIQRTVKLLVQPVLEETSQSFLYGKNCVGM